MGYTKSKTLESIIDKTFAVRLHSFVKDITVCDAMSEEEKDYLLYVSKELLKYQLDNMKESDKWYYDNIKDTVNKILNDNRY